MSELLKGGGHAGTERTPASAITNASGLNRLSDAAEKIEVVVKPSTLPGHSLTIPTLNATLASQGLSQEQLIDAAQPMQFQQPSQPDIPPPILPESQTQPNPGDDNTRNQPNAIGTMLPPDSNIVHNLMSGMLTAPGALTGLPLDFQQLYNPYGIGSYGSQEDDVQGLQASRGGGGSGKNRKQTRRGPMDEMRQLVRILVKVFPQSVGFIGSAEESGGGNRISEDQIKSYLDRCLGEAPRPTWGVPTGWHGYLAELFSWGTDKVVTGEECKRVAKREPGRSWEAIESELTALGAYPHCWPLPLTKNGVLSAQMNPVPLPIPSVPKKSGGGSGGGGGGGSGGSGLVGGSEGGANGGVAPVTHAPVVPRRSRAIDREMNKMDEGEVWKLINDALVMARRKMGSSADVQSVMVARAAAKAKVDEMIAVASATAEAMAAANLGGGGGGGTGAGGAVSYLPLIPGLDSTNLMNFMQSVGGFTGSSLDPKDPNTAAAALAAAALGVPTMNSSPTLLNQQQHQHQHQQQGVGSGGPISPQQATKRQRQDEGNTLLAHLQAQQDLQQLQQQQQNDGGAFMPDHRALLGVAFGGGGGEARGQGPSPAMQSNDPNTGGNDEDREVKGE